MGEPVVAAGRLRCSRPVPGGRRDFVSAVIRVLAVVAARRDRELPPKVVVAVTGSRVYVFRSRLGRIGPEVAVWDRAHLRATTSDSARGAAVWFQPPGDRAGFELRGTGAASTRALVSALAR